MHVRKRWQLVNPINNTVKESNNVQVFTVLRILRIMSLNKP